MPFDFRPYAKLVLPLSLADVVIACRLTSPHLPRRFFVRYFLGIYPALRTILLRYLEGVYTPGLTSPSDDEHLIADESDLDFFEAKDALEEVVLSMRAGDGWPMDTDPE